MITPPSILMDWRVLKPTAREQSKALGHRHRLGCFVDDIDAGGQRLPPTRAWPYRWTSEGSYGGGMGATFSRSPTTEALGDTLRTVQGALLVRCRAVPPRAPSMLPRLLWLPISSPSALTLRAICTIPSRGLPTRKRVCIEGGNELVHPSRHQVVCPLPHGVPLPAGQVVGAPSSGICSSS